jgi:hypothetical protein
MAKERGTLERCLEKTIHHSHMKAQLLATAAGVLSVEDVNYRFKLMGENTEAALKQVQKIRKAATKAKCKSVLQLLDAKTLEFGHNR